MFAATRKFSAALLLALGLSGILTAPAAADRLEAAELVEKANFTVQRFLENKDVGPNVRSLMRRAAAVIIYPNVLKGAFFFGAEGGHGVLLAKASNGAWTYPAFYFMGSASFGLQIGGKAGEVMLIVMNDRALTAILNNEVTLGADLSAAAGPVGVGAQASTTTNVGEDIYAFSINEGAFLGGSVEGAVVHPRQSYNESYYNDPKATPETVVLQGQFANAQADKLRATLATIK